MTTPQKIPSRASANPALPGPFDAEFDIIVVGGGGGGLPAALFARWLGNSVGLLEKAAELGGTARKAAFWYWVPNNKKMREVGLVDGKVDFLRYVARLSCPQSYNPEDPRLGLSEWEYGMCQAIYDSASPATELLSERGALPYRHCPDVPDYWAELPEDKAPRGRVLLPEAASHSMSDGGRVAIDSLSAAARRDGIDIRSGHRVQRVVRNSEGEVIGVEANTSQDDIVRIRARKAVIFATGGFTQRYEPITGGFRLSADFSQNLKAAVARFNEFARAGHDEDFHRGERPVEQLFNGTVKEEPGRTNLTLYPVNKRGPYYAALVTGGTLDTKGGAKTTVNGQVVDDQDRPIPGLYGVGNCVASASGRAYWAGGATLGPIIAFAYRAAYAAHAEPVKDADLIEELPVHH